MKRTLTCSAAVLALAVAAWAGGCSEDSGYGPSSRRLRRLPPLDLAELKRVGRFEFGKKEFADEKHGVFVHLVKDKQGEASEISSMGPEVSTSLCEPHVSWYQEGGLDSKGGAVYRFRLSAETLTYVVTSADVPGDVRWIALREIDLVDDFAEGQKLRLIERASRDAEPWIRDMAVLQSAKYEPLREAIPILCRALADPSLSVSWNACGPVSTYFFPPKVNRKQNDREIVRMTGSPTACAEYRSSVVKEVARKVHEIRPDLVTDEDLATIDRLHEEEIRDLERYEKNVSEGKTDPKAKESSAVKIPALAPKRGTASP